VGVTTHTVCTTWFRLSLVFLIQWIFLGDLRSAVIVGVNIHCPVFLDYFAGIAG